MDDQSISPSPQKPIAEEVHLSFYDALKAVADGKKITKAEWENQEIYGFINTFLMLHKPEAGDRAWTISDGDLAGNDWIVL